MKVHRAIWCSLRTLVIKCPLRHIDSATAKLATTTKDRSKVATHCHDTGMPGVVSIEAANVVDLSVLLLYAWVNLWNGNSWSLEDVVVVGCQAHHPDEDVVEGPFHTTLVSGPAMVKLGGDTSLLWLVEFVFLLVGCHPFQSSLEGLLSSVNALLRVSYSFC